MFCCPFPFVQLWFIIWTEFFSDGEYPNQIELRYSAMSEMLLRGLWQMRWQSKNSWISSLSSISPTVQQWLYSYQGSTVKLFTWANTCPRNECLGLDAKVVGKQHFLPKQRFMEKETFSIQRLAFLIHWIHTNKLAGRKQTNKKDKK